MEKGTFGRKMDMTMLDKALSKQATFLFRHVMCLIAHSHVNDVQLLCAHNFCQASMSKPGSKHVATWVKWSLRHSFC